MVGSHATLVEFLDKGRSGMASSFLTRAAVGSSLVDAKAVARLYEHRVRSWLVLLVLLVGLLAVGAAIATTPVGQDWWDQVQRLVGDDLTSWFKGADLVTAPAPRRSSRSSSRCSPSPSASRLAAARCRGTTGRGRQRCAGKRRTRALKDKAPRCGPRGAFDEALNQARRRPAARGPARQRTVTLVVLPGVDDDTVQATRQALKAARAASVSSWRMLSRDLVDPGKKTYVDSVVPARSRAPRTSTNGRRREHLRPRRSPARPRVRRSGLRRRASTTRRPKIDSELEGARLVKLDDEPLGRGSYVVVLAPGHHGTDSFTTAEMVISHALVYALAKGADAVVVASTPTSSLPGGLIDVVSGDKDLEAARFATINVVDSAAGRTATVYALAAAASSAPGHYGLDGEEVVLPPGLAAQNDN